MNRLRIRRLAKLLASDATFGSCSDADLALMARATEAEMELSTLIVERTTSHRGDVDHHQLGLILTGLDQIPNATFRSGVSLYTIEQTAWRNSSPSATQERG